MNLERDLCWITWEDHRRSREIAKSLGAKYFFVESNDRFVVRHLLKGLKTIRILYNHRSSIIVVQNPSRVLAGIAAILKIIFRYPLVVDRHTNFRLGKGFTFNPAIWFVILCSEISIKLANITIVTNDFLKNLVESKGGEGFVLFDKIPELNERDFDTAPPKTGSCRKDILFICTYAPDEPYRQVIDAAKLLPENLNISITGNYHKAKLDKNLLPKNVTLTGFVDETEYQRLLHHSDVVLVLTESEWCLVCGGYESMAAGKPLITSPTDALRNFYGDSAIYTEHSPKAISDAITFAAQNSECLSERIKSKKMEKDKIWNDSKLTLIQRLSKL
jgi:glycosyltransferase involved in cell wall biosynthesis